MNKGFLLALLLCIVYSTQVNAQCLSGTYTLGGGDPDFDSFFSLQQRLFQDGVCGPTEILLRSGTYTDILLLSNISSTSATNTLTLRAESGDPTDVVLNASVTSSTSGVVVLNFMKYVTLQDLTIKPAETGSSFGRGVSIRNNSSHITLRNLVLEGYEESRSGDTDHALVCGQSTDALLIEDCIFQQSSVGVCSGVIQQDNTNWTIRNCHFDQLPSGILLSRVDDILIADNLITGNLNTIQNDNAVNLQGRNMTLTGNTIITDGSALSIFSNAGEVTLLNNMMAVAPIDGTQFSPVSIFGTATTRMDHTSIVMQNYAGPFPVPALQVSASEQLQFRNNVVVNEAVTGFACRFDAVPTGSMIDHNIYFSNNETFQFSSTQLYTLDDWQSTFAQDANSRKILPVFASVTDLHLDPDAVNNQFLNAQATPLADVTTDIDGELRDAQNPDIGADEFGGSVSGIDVSLLSTNLTGELCDGVRPFQVMIQNNSDVPLSYLEIDWAINDGVNNILVYEGPLAPNSSAEVTLTELYLTQNETYNISLRANLPNGGPDTAPADNLLNTAVSVWTKPLPILTAIGSGCPLSTTTLGTAAVFTNYQWSNEETTIEIAVSPGTYGLTVADANGCTGSDVYWIPEEELNDTRVWMTDGVVDDIEVWGDELFVGGDFDEISPYQPGLGAIDRTTGKHIPFPAIEVGNTVDVIVSDGNGGYFVGGDFAVIGGRPRQNLAHINAQGEVSDWRTDVNGLVYSLYLDGDRLFVGGDFTEIGGRARNAIAALSTQYGHTLDWAAPIFEAGDIIRAFSVYEDFLVVGGLFNRSNDIFGSNNLFLINLADGQFPNINNTLQTFRIPEVLQIELYNDILYLATITGGHQLDISTGAAERIAAVINNGNSTGLARNGDRLYIYAFDQVREYDLPSQSFTDWMLQPMFGTITAGTVHNGQLLLSGNFGEMESDIALDALWVFDLASLTETTFTTYALRSGFTGVEIPLLYADDERIILSGNFDGVGGLARANVFAMDGQTAVPTDWAPNPNGRVRSVKTDLEQLYIGGAFSTVAGEERRAVAAFDDTGDLTPWQVPINGEAWTLAPGDTAVYVGGSFNTTSGGVYNNLAAFNKATGNVLQHFRPQPDDYVSELVLIDSVVIASGRYEMLYYLTDSLLLCGGGCLSVLRADNGAQVQGYSLGEQSINEIKYYNGLAYIGGRFTSISTNNRQHIAAMDPSDRPFVDWSQNVNDAVLSIALGYNTAFAGGPFNAINGQASFNLGAMDLSQSNTSYNLMPTDVNDLAFGGDMETYDGQLWVGGSFNRFLSERRSHLAAIKLECIAEDIDLQAGPGSGFVFRVMAPSSGEVQFTNNSTNASRFRWDFGDGTTSTAINPMHTYVQSGTYNVCLTADHTTGGTTSCQMVNVMPVSTDDFAFDQHWSVFPNPVDDQLMLSSTAAAAASHTWTVNVYDNTGRSVKQAILAAGAASRQLTGLGQLPAGMYTIVVSDAGARLWQSVLLKK